MAAPGEGGLIYVALHEHNEAVALRHSAMPHDPEDVLNLLSSEAAPLLCWFDAAKAYLSQAQLQAFLDIVREANSDDTLNGIRAYFAREPTFERVQMFCAVAAFYVEKARAEKDAAARAAALQEAERHVREAEALRSNEMLPGMARAALALARNDTTAAMVEYRRAERCLHNGRRNHAPLLGQAALHFNSGALADAIRIYARVLRENPACPAEVRAGIGACYYRAGKLDAAAAAYTRALELDQGCADALLGLAVIKFGSKDEQEGLNSGLQLLQRAFSADPSHPGVLCSLSHFSLLKGQVDQALELAQVALEAADTDRLRAVSLTLLGRCHHARGDLQAAQHHYAQAIRLDARAPLPHLGTAQAYLAAGGDPTNAVSELELVLRALPGNADALRLLGGLLPVQYDRVAKALASHRDAASRQVGDAGLQEMLGELLAPTEPAAALVAFDLALSLHRKRQQAAAARNQARASQRHRLAELGDRGLADELLKDVGEDEGIPQVPSKLLNNAAVLKYRAGAVAEAAELMAEATGAMMRDEGTHPMQKITMGFNMARLQEATGDLKVASAAYQALLQQFPGYIDCYLRLSAMAHAAGDVDEARRWAAAATQQAGGHVDAQAMLASLHLERGDLDAARKCVAAVGAEGRSDPYMLLTHANVVLSALPADRGRGKGAANGAAGGAEGAQGPTRDFIHKAMHMYREVLRGHPDNVYAVNGLGTCLAELGHMNAAKAAFDEVVRAMARSKGFVRLPECYVNLGNVWLGRQAYTDAVKMYGHASKLWHHKNPQVLLYMARAHLDAGDHQDAKRCLLKALHLSPGDMRLRFNLAFVLQEWSVRVFRRKYPSGSADKARDYEAAELALGEADRIFNHLHTMGFAATRIEPKKLQMHAAFCSTQLPVAQALVSQAHEEQLKEAANSKLRLAQIAAAEAERRRREMEDSAGKRAEQKRKEAEAQRALDESRAKLQALRQRQALQSVAEEPGADGSAPKGAGASGGAKRKRKKGAAGADGLGDFYVDDAQPIERLPKARKEARDVQETLRRTGLESDEEEPDEEDGDDVEALFGSDDASDGEGATAAAAAGGEDKPAAAGRGRLKRRAEAGAEAPPGGSAGAGGEPGDGETGGLGGDGGGQQGGGGFDVEGLFVDDTDDEGGDGGAAAGGQPRKRQRQALESDDEGGGDSEEAPAGGGGGAAAEEDDVDGLFD